MSDSIHIYCDESCHLENDGMKAMVLGALWCPASHRKFTQERDAWRAAQKDRSPGTLLRKGFGYSLYTWQMSWVGL